MLAVAWHQGGMHRQSVCALSYGLARPALPGLLDARGRAKWAAWERQKGKPQEEAAREYIALVDELHRRAST